MKQKSPVAIYRRPAGVARLRSAPPLPLRRPIRRRGTAAARGPRHGALDRPRAVEPPGAAGASLRAARCQSGRRRGPRRGRCAHGHIVRVIPLARAAQRRSAADAAALRASAAADRGGAGRLRPEFADGRLADRAPIVSVRPIAGTTACRLRPAARAEAEARRSTAAAAAAAQTCGH